MADEGEVRSQQGFPPEPPRCGSLEATIDDKGRLRIPAQYIKYISSLGDTKVFIACKDKETARVYPLSVWQQNEAHLSTTPTTAEAAEARQLFEWMVRVTGGESEWDTNGRVSLPQKVRDLLGITPKSSVHMTFFDGAFDLQTDAVMQRSLANVLEQVAANRSVLRASGIR